MHFVEGLWINERRVGVIHSLFKRLCATGMKHVNSVTTYLILKWCTALKLVLQNCGAGNWFRIWTVCIQLSIIGIKHHIWLMPLRNTAENQSSLYTKWLWYTIQCINIFLWKYIMTSNLSSDASIDIPVPASDYSTLLMRIYTFL